tara:strand:+ start:337 stop:1317 length:981 start_codon:yes stop_codon:yes gene_type:complete
MAGGQVFGVPAYGGRLAQDRLSKKFRAVAQEKMRWRQFSVKQNDFGKGQGQILLFNKRLNLDSDPSGGFIIAERAKVPSSGYKILQGQCVARTSAHKVPYTEEAEVYSEFSLDKENREVLTDAMAKALNNRTKDEFWATNVAYTPTGTDGAPIGSWDVDGTVSNTATRDVQIFDLKNIVDALEEGDYGGNASAPAPYYDGANYQQIAAVSTLRAYKDDPEWEDAARFGSPDRLWSGEKGRIYSCRSVADNHILGKLGGTYKGESVIFGKDPVMECIAVPEEIRMEIPTDLARDKAIGCIYIGGFKLVWEYNATTEPDNRVVKIASA